MRPRELLALRSTLLTTLGLCSCSFYEWRDEPYIRPIVASGTAAAAAELQSGSGDERAIACRALGQLAHLAQTRNDPAEARRIAQLLMDHFEVETCHQVRSVIVALALRDIGRGNRDVEAFLLARLAADELPVAAGYTLAVLRPAGTFEALRDALLRSPYERRHELLQALWLLGDPRAGALFDDELQRLDAEWPSEIHHMDKEQYRRVLSGRARTLPTAPSGQPNG